MTLTLTVTLWQFVSQSWRCTPHHRIITRYNKTHLFTHKFLQNSSHINTGPHSRHVCDTYLIKCYFGGVLSAKSYPILAAVQLFLHFVSWKSIFNIRNTYVWPTVSCMICAPLHAHMVPGSPHPWRYSSHAHTRRMQHSLTDRPGTNDEWKALRLRTHTTHTYFSLKTCPNILIVSCWHHRKQRLTTTTTMMMMMIFNKDDKTRPQ